MGKDLNDVLILHAGSGGMSGKGSHLYNSQKEKDVKAAIKKILKERGIWFTMPYQAGFSQAGVPDFICCAKGLFLAIEAKFHPNKPTAMQHLRMAEIMDAGGIALVIDDRNVGELAGILDDMFNQQWGR